MCAHQHSRVDLAPGGLIRVTTRFGDTRRAVTRPECAVGLYERQADRHPRSLDGIARCPPPAGRFGARCRGRLGEQELEAGDPNTLSMANQAIGISNLREDAHRRRWALAAAGRRAVARTTSIVSVKASSMWSRIGDSVASRAAQAAIGEAGHDIRHHLNAVERSAARSWQSRRVRPRRAHAVRRLIGSARGVGKVGLPSKEPLWLVKQHLPATPSAGPFRRALRRSPPLRQDQLSWVRVTRRPTQVAPKCRRALAALAELASYANNRGFVTP